MSQPEIKTSLVAASGPLAEVETSVLVLAASPRGDFGNAARQADEALGGLIGRSRKDGWFKGGLFDSEWIVPTAGVRAGRILLLGTGKPDQSGPGDVRRLAGAAVRQARRKGASRICLALDPPEGLSSAAAAEVVADGAYSALYDSALYKAAPGKTEVDEIAIWAGGEGQGAAIERGQALATCVNFARWLGDEPSNIMTTVRVAEEARKAAEAAGVQCEVLDEEQIRKLGMNLLLAVAAGSQYPPCVVVLTYKGGGTGPTLGLVGKGVTFDSGGISIKPAQDMHYMKYDMCGAADVIAATLAMARLKVPANVIAVAGLVENMPGGRATRPGDVVRGANGKSVEIINTDAEGRLVLADALDLAIKRGADRLVDVATLTGAIKIALADVATGVMGRPQTWADSLLSAAREAGEVAWQMPLFPEYKDKLRSNIADLMNTGGRFGGAVTAAAFLEQFTGDKPWVHLDVAGTAWTEKDTAWQVKGATGAMIRTLVALGEQTGSGTTAS